MWPIKLWPREVLVECVAHRAELGGVDRAVAVEIEVREHLLDLCRGLSVGIADGMSTARGIGAPVLKTTASAEKFPTVRSHRPTASLRYGILVMATSQPHLCHAGLNTCLHTSSFFRHAQHITRNSDVLMSCENASSTCGEVCLDTCIDMY